MANFTAHGNAPGVYMLEESVAGPIQGVSTSMVAFVGAASKGPEEVPALITNWMQYVNLFGGYEINNSSSGTVYVPYAVKGFFDNGGSVCKFVRVKGNGTVASSTWKDTNGKEALRVAALNVGQKGNKIQCTIREVEGTEAFVPDLQKTVQCKIAVKDNVGMVNLTDKSNFCYFQYDGISVGEISFDDPKGGTSSAKVICKQGKLVLDDQGFQAVKDLINQESEYTIQLLSGQKEQKTVCTDGSKVINALSKGGLLTINADGSRKEVVMVKELVPDKNLIILETGFQNQYTQMTIKSLGYSITVDGPSGSEPKTFSLGNIYPSLRLKDVELSPVQKTLVPPYQLKLGSDPVDLTGGRDADNPEDGSYIAAIDVLEKDDEISILCVPDSQGKVAIQKHIIEHCDKMKNRFAILDAGSQDNQEVVLKYLEHNISSSGGFAAVYYPWLTISDPSNSKNKLNIPPSGHIAGVYARVDANRGVFKAPANEPVYGVLDVTATLTATDQGICNDHNLNIIKPFPGKGILVWGARTVAPPSSTQWRYINVRRLLIYIEESLKRGTMFAVFEPNNPSLWGSLKRQITGFLTNVWRSGALIGQTADKSFEVIVDETNNPPDSIQQGILNIQVKLYPTTPAEYIVFSIIQTPGGADVQE